MRILIVFFMITSWSATVQAFEWEDSPKVESVFTMNGITGTFVLYDAQTGVFTGYNKQRAATRFIPASTYKIPNTLIGLSVGAVSDVDEIFPYDGKPRDMDCWEKNMSLREAIKVSCVPVYQELARRIGPEKMRDELAKLDYGNNETNTDTFWLNGPLAISPLEQACFLARLARGTLALPEKAQASTREILLTEQNNGWALFAKTGTAARQSPHIGWWVGWVEKHGRIYSFALNMELPQDKNIPTRADIGRQCLTVLGIIVN